MLAEADCSTLSVRAGVVIGAGSTSYEVVRQLASLLLVQPVPPWMRSSVQPVAVSDVVRALVAAFEDGAPEGDVDLGGPDVIALPPAARGAYARAARLPRLHVPALVAPVSRGRACGGAAGGAPFRTVTALVASLRHDMVARPDHLWQVDDEPMLGVDEALDRAVGRSGPDVAEAPLPSNAAWTRMRAPVPRRAARTRVPPSGRQPRAGAGGRRAGRVPPGRRCPDRTVVR